MIELLSGVRLLLVEGLNLSVLCVLCLLPCSCLKLIRVLFSKTIKSIKTLLVSLCKSILFLSQRLKSSAVANNITKFFYLCQFLRCRLPPCKRLSKRIKCLHLRKSFSLGINLLPKSSHVCKKLTSIFYRHRLCCTTISIANNTTLSHSLGILICHSVVAHHQRRAALQILIKALHRAFIAQLTSKYLTLLRCKGCVHVFPISLETMLLLPVCVEPTQEALCHHLWSTS